MLACNRLINVRRRALRAMEHTCPASRHLEVMADTLASDESYLMLEEDPKYCAATMYSVLESLWKARKTIEKLKLRNFQNDSRRT